VTSGPDDGSPGPDGPSRAGTDDDPAPPPLRVARVVVEVEPLHLDRPFDYRIPDDLDLVVGQRVQVVFAGRMVRGLVLEVTDRTEVEADRLLPVRRALGEHAWVREDELGLLRWAAGRFGAPLADVVRHALPSRTVEVERAATAAGWFPPGAGRRPSSDPAPDLATLDTAWEPYGDPGRGLRDAVAGGQGSFLWRPLPGEDIAARLAELAQLCLAGDRDVLLVVPDPASPVADAVVSAAGDLAVDLRGGPSPRVQYRRWLEARCGVARVVVGERGAVWFPLDRLGLAVVLDEASPVHKERRSPRHHAREVVLERARRAGGVGLAVGTVPSAVAWRLLRERRLTAVTPSREAERRARPNVQVVTEQPGQARARLPREALRALREATQAGAYGVLLAGRRGEGRALVCASCGERHSCPTCASSLTIIRGGPFCWGCGWRARRVSPCHACRSTEVVALAAGTARFATELERGLDAPVAVLEGYAQPAPPPPAVLVMTRGSVLDAPPGPVGAVVLPDLDDALARPSLDAAEDALRLAVSVAGWTVHGRRRTEPGTVVVPTREPGHHAISALAAWDLGAFWRTEVSIRTPLRFPPIAHAIRLEVAADEPMQLLREVRAALPDGDDVLGPVPVEGRQGLLIKSEDRDASLAGLRTLREAWSKAGVEARLDVDPVDAL
jgi:primosomal protein N' (replication factor Y) (superfamily II helicase)